MDEEGVHLETRSSSNSPILEALGTQRCSVAAERSPHLNKRAVSDVRTAVLEGESETETGMYDEVSSPTTTWRVVSRYSMARLRSLSLRTNSQCARYYVDDIVHKDDYAGVSNTATGMDTWGALGV
jgi:hypothetical protein